MTPVGSEVVILMSRQSGSLQELVHCEEPEKAGEDCDLIMVLDVNVKVFCNDIKWNQGSAI